MKLTRNFNLSEFTTSAGIIIKPTDEQIFCIDKLCKNILQKVRDKFGTIQITSGLRDKASYDRLVQKGYPASRTSDHFAWSSVNPKGTGAADIVISSENTIKVFHWIIDNLYDYLGQVIYYEDKNFIHVSNHFNEIFNMTDTRVESTRVMTYKNGRFISYPREPKPSKHKPVYWRLIK